MPNITTTIRTSQRAQVGPFGRDDKRKTPRFRTGLFRLTTLGFQRLAVSRSSNLKLKIQKATAPR